jgi:hypothetical protein
MGKSITCTNTQRRIAENDGQVLYSGSTVGTFIRIRDMGPIRKNEADARRISQPLRETDDETIYTIFNAIVNIPRSASAAGPKWAHTV